MKKELKYVYCARCLSLDLTAATESMMRSVCPAIVFSITHSLQAHPEETVKVGRIFSPSHATSRLMLEVGCTGNERQRKSGRNSQRQSESESESESESARIRRG